MLTVELTVDEIRLLITSLDVFIAEHGEDPERVALLDNLREMYDDLSA